MAFQEADGERFYGLGQHQHGLLDQKGCVIDLWHRNTEVSIPFLVSSRGYGFLWHNPAVGRVELGRNATRWVAEASRRSTIGSRRVPTPNHGALRDATGHAPMRRPGPPASGSASCATPARRSRWPSRGSIRRGLPLDVIVADPPLGVLGRQAL